MENNTGGPGHLCSTTVLHHNAVLQNILLKKKKNLQFMLPEGCTWQHCDLNNIRINWAALTLMLLCVKVCEKATDCYLYVNVALTACCTTPHPPSFKKMTDSGLNNSYLEWLCRPTAHVPTNSWLLSRKRGCPSAGASRKRRGSWSTCREASFTLRSALT